MVDRLVGLRLHAVVGGHDDDRDVGHAGAAGAHRGERLVAGRVEEGDELAVVVDLVGADVLRDAAGLALDDLGRADRVQQRRLAVVDVAHDRDDRRAVGEVLVGVLVDGLGLDLVGRVDDLDLLAELLGEDADGVVGQRLRERRHLAEHHELLDDLRDGHAHRLGDVLDRRAGVDPDEVGVRRGGLVRAARRCRRTCRGGGARGAGGAAAAAAGRACGARPASR